MKTRSDRVLLLLFVLSLPVCVWAWLFWIPLLLFFPVVPCFCLQLWMCRVVRSWWLRAIPALPTLVLGGLALFFLVRDSGWDRLGAFIFGVGTIAPAVGVLFGWAVYLLQRHSLSRRTRGVIVLVLVLIGCVAMAMVEVLTDPDYAMKSVAKVLLFLGCVGVYVLASRERLGWFQKPAWRDLKQALALAALTFFGILGGYALLSPWLDLSAIPGALAGGAGVTAEIFPLVALYITLCNSLLEEIFFRGFAFLTLRRHCAPALTWGFSAGSFAVYHVSIMDGWFHPAVFLLFTLGLAAAGALFNFLDRRGSIWNGWLVHMAANLAINLIGMRMFGIF